MRATKLIRDKGLKYAKEIVNSAPKNATEWNEGYEFQCGQSVEVSPADREKYFVDLVELESLVESLGYISRWGGIERCKKLYFDSPFKRDQHIKDLKRYIRDYESVYQIKCSHGYDVACLICGFGTVDGERIYHNKGKTA